MDTQKQPEKKEKMKLVIGFRLPSLNEAIEKNRAGGYSGNAFKQDVEGQIRWYIRVARNKRMLAPIPAEWKKGCILRVGFFEPDKRRDVDNIISGGLKFILDGLVKEKILPDDSQRYVAQIYPKIFHTEGAGHVVVFIEENRDGGEVQPDAEAKV